jgi:predicted amidohydrolase
MESVPNEGRTKAMLNHVSLVGLLFVALCAQTAFAGTIKIGIAQTVIEPTLQKNCEKLCSFIDHAGSMGCQVVIFPEGALYWSDIATHKPTKAQLDSAIAQIGQRADAENVYAIFGVGYRETNAEPYTNRGIVFDPDGHRVLFYKKNAEVPQSFGAHGIQFNLSICSDRGYLEHSDLPCLVQGSQVIIDISGGHGGDDGRPDLRWIRYRPWALRTGAYVIVSNPVHDDTDFMGHNPWGGGSAIIRPDGSIQASRTYEKDTLIVEQIDTSLTTRDEARRRRNHPLFKPFWDMGEKLLDGEDTVAAPQIKPFTSAERNIKIAAAQIACSRDISKNVGKITDYIQRAAAQGADIVVFPELAVTGCSQEGISAASQSALDSALNRIQNETDDKNVYVIVGMPYSVDGHRMNCAFVIGDDGSVRTRYAQIAARRDDLFRSGTSTKAMWFELKGVHSIVTIGDDANWVEIADLAAGRGMYLHFHIANESYSSIEQAKLGKQRNLLMLMYAKYGAVVNAATPSDEPHPGARRGGMSMIVSREGGHNRHAPSGLEYYLPYQTSVVASAGSTETMIFAVRRTSARNDMDLIKYWRNRNRKNRTQSGWYEWINRGALLIDEDVRPTPAD